MSVPTKQITVEIWPSSKIRFAYLEDNYNRRSGTIGNSCMRHKNMQKALNFYVKNGVQIIVVVDTNKKIYARALLWSNIHMFSSKKTGITYVDRIYYSAEVYYQLLCNFIKDNNYTNSYEFGCQDNKSQFYIPNIKLDGITHLPYADTFRKLDIGSHILYVSPEYKPKKLSTDKRCSLTVTNNGGYVPMLDPNSTEEVFTGSYISKKDSIYIGMYKGYVHKDHIVDIGGKYFSRYDEKNLVRDTSGNHILRKNAVTEKFTGHTIDKTTAVEVKRYKGYVSKVNVIKLDNQLYSTYDYEYVCLTHAGYALISKCYKMKYNGQYVNKKDASIAYDLTEDLDGKIDFINEQYIDACQSRIPLNDGTYVISTPENRKYVRMFNGKYYLKTDVPKKDKKQLQLFV